ncbi:MAG: hypothetical protein KJO91_06410, partial [Gammaproteobacteria bacterium]|nr:hypothetical protein [Gammaproteobacteria bacterium]
NANGDRFEVSASDFTENGRYEIYYFVRDVTTEEISPMVSSVVYKDKAGNQPPPPVTLISPTNNEVTRTVLRFDWSDVTDPTNDDAVDPNNDEVRYQLLIASDPDFINIVHRQDDLTKSWAIVDKSAGLKDKPAFYYWKVIAVDNYGATSASSTWIFRPDDTNGVPGILRGIVFSDRDFSRLAARLTLDSVNESGIIVWADDDGEYVVVTNAGLVDLTAELPGSDFKITALSGIEVAGGGTTELNIVLPPDIADTDIDGIADDIDNCINDANPTQANHDGDNLGDACDPDDDNDNVLDSDDAFPLSVAVSVDTDEDGIPDEWNSGCDTTCQVDSGYVLDAELPRKRSIINILLPILLNQ